MSQKVDDFLNEAIQEENYRKNPVATLEPFDKDAYREKKKAELETAYQDADNAIRTAVQNAENYAGYLNVQARFPQLSVTNAMLLTLKRPDATQLFTKQELDEKHILIKQGETGIVQITRGKSFQGEDGAVHSSFQTRKVFDISQTDAPPHPQPEIRRDQRLMTKALIRNAPCSLVVDDTLGHNTAAVYRADKHSIHVRRGLDFDDMFRALARELAYAHMDKDGGFRRSDYNLLAASVSYMVCVRNHIAPVVPDSTMLKCFENKDPQKVRGELSEIRSVANTFFSNMEQVLGENQPARVQTQNPPDVGAR